jgi:hypothetical protein
VCCMCMSVCVCMCVYVCSEKPRQRYVTCITIIDTIIHHILHIHTYTHTTPIIMAQAKTGADTPLLLKTDMSSGHFSASDRYIKCLLIIFYYYISVIIHIILLKTDMSSGHFSASDRYKFIFSYSPLLLFSSSPLTLLLSFHLILLLYLCLLISSASDRYKFIKETSFEYTVF